MSLTGIGPAFQAGVPGAVELLIVLVVLLVIVVGAAVWVYRDARKHGMNGALWAVVVGGLFLLGLVPGLIGLVVYFWQRGEASTRPTPT